MNDVTGRITSAFHIARSKHQAENKKWIALSHALAGRMGIVPMISAIQHAGEVDLVLRAMEDEFRLDSGQDVFAFNYQMMLSETWILACYEPFRAIRQRDRENAERARKNGQEQDADAVSNIYEFRSVFQQLELLRMPIAKFEIAKDDKMKAPLRMQTIGVGPAKEVLYDNMDPSRFHIMPAAVAANGRIGWQALDHINSHEVWIERRSLSDLLLAIGDKIEPAGLREARLKAELEAASLKPETP